MGEIYRIIDRINLSGSGTIYMMLINKGSLLKVNDVLFDLRGNSFRIKAYEMFRICFSDPDPDERPTGVLLENIDGTDVEGNILVKDNCEISFIFCNHPLYQRKVDEDYEEEYQEAGLNHPCALFSYEDMEEGKLSLYGEKISGLAIYRGWMMKPEMYKDFYYKLTEQGIILINTPEDYERYHTLPGWYNDFKDNTAESVWEDQGDIESAMKLTRRLEGPYIVKDYVKSRKHEWYDACYINNIADQENARKTIETFVDRQGTNLMGGIVLRKFEKLKAVGFHEKSGMPISEEYRVFIFAGKVGIIDNYWQEGQSVSFSEKEYKWIEEMAEKIKSGFATMDLARREDGKLIIMELGDGQVSGLQQIPVKIFYKMFNLLKN